MEDLKDEGLDTSLADETPIQFKTDHPKQELILEECLQTLDKPADTRTNEEIDRFAHNLVALGIFDRSCFGNLEPVGFLKKLIPYMKHEIYSTGSALLHINHTQQKACVIVKGKAKEFVPRNAKEIEIESRNSLSNAKAEKMISKTVNELSDSDNKWLKPGNITQNQPKSLTSIVEENEPDMLSPARKRRFARSTRIQTIKINSNTNNAISLNSLDKYPSIKITLQDEHVGSKSTLKSSLKSTNNSGSINGTLGNFDEQGNNEEFMDEFRKFPKNYFIGEVLKIKYSKTLGPGSYFGTKSFGKITTAKQAILATEECHCITLHREHYLAALAEEKTLHREKIEFFLNIFPTFDRETVTEFSLLWDEQLHKRGDIIYQEGDPSTMFFIVFKGEITISKEVADPLAGRRNSDGMGLIKKKNLSPVQVAVFCQGSLFGEEFFKKKPRVFTAMVSSSKARILHLSRNDYRAITKKYPEIFAKIKETVKLSSKVNAQRLESLIQTYRSDLNREAVQEAYLNQKEQVLKSERRARTGHTKTVSMIMRPTTKPKNINVRLQYDKYFVCKPGQKYPEYLKMVIEGNIKPDPTEKNSHVGPGPKRSGTTVTKHKRKLSTPMLRESEDFDPALNFVSRQSHQRTPSLYKMTQIPIPKEDESKYNLSTPQTYRITINNSALGSERTTIEDSIYRQNYFQIAEPRRTVMIEAAESVEALTAASTRAPLRLSELDQDQRNGRHLVSSERKCSKPMKGMDLKFNQQISDYTPVMISTSKNNVVGAISKTPINNKLLSGPRGSGHSTAKSLNNLPSVPPTTLPQTKFEMQEKLKGTDASQLPSLRSPQTKVYGSLNDLNEIFSPQERRSLMNVELGTFKKL